MVMFLCIFVYVFSWLAPWLLANVVFLSLGCRVAYDCRVRVPT